jgi:hypothetical protein
MGSLNDDEYVCVRVCVYSNVLKVPPTIGAMFLVCLGNTRFLHLQFSM